MQPNQMLQQIVRVFNKAPWMKHGVIIQKILVLISITGFAWINFFSELAVSKSEGYKKGNLRRFVAVCRMECFLTLLNVFAYNEIMEGLEEDVSKLKPYERKRNLRKRQKWSLCLILFFICSQLIYFMYYAPRYVQFFLFDITSICAGVWTNLIAFVCGFWLVNFIKRIMMSFRTTSKILDWISKVPVIYHFIWKRKVQLRCIFIVTFVLSTSMYISSDWVIIKHKTIKIQNFTSTSPELRIAVISDLHAGASVYKNQIMKVVNTVTKHKVDAIVLVGDVVDAPLQEISQRVEPILKFPLYAPTFFVTGNHEYYYGNVDEWLELYKNASIKVLDNRGELFNGICLAGVNDISSPKSGASSDKMDIKKALNDCPEGVSKIVLAHNPASIKEFQIDAPVEFESVDLVISGHTHAGQFYVVVPVAYGFLPYFYGLYEITHKTKLMITAGTLYQGPPMKMLGMSEVWILELVGN